MVLYNFLIHSYGLLIRLLSPFHRKAGLFMHERNQHPFQLISSPTQQRIWFHCASLGEFDQALPLMRLFEEQGESVVVSFFSPSGYMATAHKSKYKNIDFFYAPLDHSRTYQEWIPVINPKMLIVVKYEFWYHMIDQAKFYGAKVILVCAYFSLSQFYFRYPLNRFYNNIFRKFDKIFTLDVKSARILKENDRKLSVAYAGDMRVAQCMYNKEQDFPTPLLSTKKENKKLILFGSCWNEEIRIAMDWLDQDQNLLIVLAPHEVHKKSINSILKKFSNYRLVQWSQSRHIKNLDPQVILIDTIGDLKYLYRFADLAFIGGGFSGKLHNVLEAVVYGIPVMSGPRIQKFPEALILKNKDVLRIWTPSMKLIDVLEWTHESKHPLFQEKINNFIISQSDAAKSIKDGLN